MLPGPLVTRLRSARECLRCLCNFLKSLKNSPGAFSARAASILESPLATRPSDKGFTDLAPPPQH